MYTVLQRGSFVVGANVVPQLLQVPSGVDFIWVKNLTQTAAAGAVAARGYEFYWQDGMAQGSAIVSYKPNGLLTRCDDVITTGGITFFNPSSTTQEPVVSAPIVTTAATNAVQPVVATATTPNVGDIVQKYDAQNNIDGIPMVVSAVTPGVNFTLLTATNALQQLPGAIGGAGTYRVVSYPMFYPNTLYITNIAVAGTNLTVSTSTQHGLTPGQIVRFSIPSLFGSTELNSNSFNNYQTFTIQSVGAAGDTFVVTAPIGGITAFVFPTIAQFNASLDKNYAIVVPVGMNTGNALTNTNAQVPLRNGLQINATQTGIYADARVNTSFVGVRLGTGGTATALGAAVTGPAGSVAGDVVYWVAGKSEID